MRSGKRAMGWVSVLWCACLVAPGAADARAAGTGHSPLQLCGEATRTQPGIGTAYHGMVQNDTYALSALVPPGLTAWSGVATEAPFHGFTMFLGPESCVIFQIQLRVEDDPAPNLRGATKRLDGVRMIESRRVALRKGARFLTRETVFSHAQPHEIDDGSVLLITPESRRAASERAYEQFVRSLNFHGR
ncbi:hypothetical protein [Terriglobus sp.]|uniref:hypothetical protein n=1 Tax=Terriglobus sp. TaxID=1889013 RepID=UPI003B001FA1